MNIQQELKCRKSQYNKFGGFYFRSCEDILESVKPLLEKYKVAMIISDEISTVGERVYVKATVSLIDTENTEKVITSSAYAREPKEKTKMDEPQITGTASSYARKYALNGLFLIDDTKDADTNEYQQQTRNEPPPAETMITANQVNDITNLVQQTGADSKKILEYYHVQNIGQLTERAAAHCIDNLRKKLK